MNSIRLLVLLVLCVASAIRANEPTAQNSFTVTLPRPAFPDALRPESPFGINTAFNPNTPDLDARLKAMQQAGIKWGRQDFTWRRSEKTKGEYEWEPYDRLVAQCHAHGVLIFGNLTYNPAFYDMRTDEGVEAYCAFARAAVKRYAGKVDHWQIRNEPNLGYLGGEPKEYARLLAASGKAIHETNPKAKVLGLNMAFCDALWAEKILQLVPNDCFDIACFHPYRNPNAPEDKFDWWVLDQYVKRFHKELTPDFPMVHQSFLEQTDELIATMKKFGPPKPLWVTEMCFNTHIKWVRNDSFGPDIYAVTFTDDAKGEDTMALWSPKPFAYVRINNTEKGLTFYDVYGTKRFVPYNKVRTGHLPVPLGESPVYVIGPKGLKASVRPDPGW